MKKIVIAFCITLFPSLQVYSQGMSEVGIRALEKSAESYAEQGNYSEAIRLCSEALENRERVSGKEDADNVITLNNLAGYYANMGNYEEAVRLGTEALKIWKRKYGKEQGYATLLNILAGYYSDMGNYEEAIRLGEEALRVREEVDGRGNRFYAMTLNCLADFNSHIGNHAEAIRLETEAIEIWNNLPDKENYDYARSLNILAGYYANIANYEEAIRLETEALENTERQHGKEHSDYATFLSSLARYNAHQGNYAEALRLGTEALERTERIHNKEDSCYATSLNNLAIYYSDMGNYEEAIRLGTEALEIKGRVLGKKHWGYAISLNNLAGYYSSMGNYEDAIRFASEAMEIIENIHGKDNSAYATSLNSLAVYYANMGDYEEAIRLGTEALEIRGRVLGEEHPDYANSLSNLAGYYMDNYEEAIRLVTEALKIRGRVLGKEHPDYATTLNSMANVNFHYGKNAKVSHYATETAQAYSSIIRKTFSDLTANERRMFWNKFNRWFKEDLPFCTYCIGSDSLVETAYDGALMSKGLLLNSEIEMNRLLLESGDATAVRKYNELQSNRMMLNRLYEKPIVERYINTDSIEAVVQKQEQELVRLSKTYGDYTRNLNIDWRQVRDKLKDDDVAIEFLNFGDRNDSVMYVALTLSRNDSCPRMIPLFEQEELDTIQGQYTKKVSELVWKPLAEVIEGKRNIYFSPAGKLHNIAIESLPCFDEEGYMSDKWNIYRLSSTRELAIEKDRYAMRDACIYGDLRYNMGVDCLVANSEKYEDTKRGVDWETVDIADSLSLRGTTLKPLHATRDEIENVDRALREQHVNTTLLTDTIGTETSFKALSGKNMNVLHIATHGFYWTESKVESTDARRIKTLMEADMSPTYMEDKAMTRSGLFFAGAQSALDGEEIPENVDDGILTAKEISMLDLRGLDMIVLSACETGLGDVTGDGVFGLQRGFKKAGAQTIVMSLADVGDKPTEIFMTRFYSNLKDGEPKHEAFKEAQTYLRDYKGEGQTETEKLPYAEPQYWAPFIILDAFN